VPRLPASDGKVSLDFEARRFVNYTLLESGHRYYVSMVHPLKVLVLFLDYQVVDFIVRLPSWLKMAAFRFKHLLNVPLRITSWIGQLRLHGHVG